MMAHVSIQNLKKSYDDVQTLHGLDLTFEKGEFVVIVGPSGCGKSTLLRMIAGLEDITSGQIALDGQVVNTVDAAQRGCAMVFQNYALYPHMTVADNIGYPLKLAKVKRDERDRRVREAAEVLGLTPYLDRRPKQLSGGQRQRVAMGRAIVRQPKLFLFDEPLSNLDAALRMNTRLEIANLHRSLKGAMIYVTHDQTEAMTLADKIVVLRDGRVEQVGSPIALYNDPDNRFVAGFLGAPAMNFLPASRIGGAEGLTAGIRPEHLVPQAEGPLGGRVLHVESLGGDTNVIIDAGLDEPLTQRMFGHHEVHAGEEIRLGFDPAKVLYFDDAGNRVR